MPATLAAGPFDHPDWIYEPKFDGLRVLGRFDGHALTLLSRNGQAQDFRFPEVSQSLRTALKRPSLVDGEIVCFDAHGRTSFRLLQQRFHLKDAAEVAARRERYPAFVYLFDLLWLDGRDVTELPLEERKKLLQGAVRWSDRVRWTDFHEADGKALYRRACREGAEGVMAKRRSSRYAAGRSDAWLKVKCVGRQEFVVGGFTDPQRSRVGLGALLVGYCNDAGRLRYAGKVGTGYTRAALLDLRRRLDELKQHARPFAEGEPPRGGHVHWVRPELVAEVAFGEWTQHGHLRMPRFEGLRPDKSPRECRRERPRAPPPTDPGEAAMSLAEYKAKRDFRRTSEPPARAAAGRSRRRPLFVVQEHHASRLHYDFRLEADGVLKSWAVPKGPSMDPGEKRLAVQVEDHPLGYASFEGEIPEGQYGAGTVQVWDSGVYDNLLAEKAAPKTVAEGIADGKLEFVLHGKRLRGRFSLVRMKDRGRGKPQWLLIKGKDEFAEAGGDGAEEKPAPRPKGVKAAAKPPAPVPPEKVELTNPDKVLFPDLGVTKRQVFEYYRRVAPRLLPHLRDRPVTLERLPEGLGKDRPHFWQKHTPAYYPDWIPRVELPGGRGKPVPYALVNDRDSLLYLVNQGTLTFHVWLSRVGDLDRPDYVLFDLDVGEGAFADAVPVAHALRRRLLAEGERAYVKTSGKSGLHVLAPWDRDGGFDTARAWAREVARRTAEEAPEQATLEVRKGKRKGRVYLDVLQNARGHHAVPPYVVRPVPAATVSMPLSWDELTPDLDPSAFTLRTAAERLKGRDPLEALVRSEGGRGRR
jgi:bifunctional non-homologous end joining protein LigD